MTRAMEGGKLVPGTGSAPKSRKDGKEAEGPLAEGPKRKVSRGRHQDSSHFMRGSARSMSLPGTLNRDAPAQDEVRQPGPMMAEHHLQPEDQHRGADDSCDPGRRRNAVRQAEEDQDEAEGAVAEGFDDSRMVMVSPLVPNSTTPQHRRSAAMCSGTPAAPPPPDRDRASDRSLGQSPSPSTRSTLGVSGRPSERCGRADPDAALRAAPGQSQSQ